MDCLDSLAMKNLLTIFTLLYVYCIEAQPPDTTTTTTIEYGIEEGELKDLRFVDAYDYVFATREEAKRLLKFNFIGLVPTLKESEIFNSDSAFAIDIDFNIDYEQKLTKNISLNSSAFIRLGLDDEKFELNNYATTLSLRFSVEPRFYYKLKKRILQGRSANNLSGNYLGIKFSTEVIPSDFISLPENFNQKLINHSAELTFGIQQRLFKRSYVDLGFGTGIGYEDVVLEAPDNTFIVDKQWKWKFNYHVGMGFALGAGLNDDFEGNRCTAFKCFVEENNLVKIDLFNIFQRLNEKEIVGRFSIGYERKIQESSWSINMAAQAFYDIPFAAEFVDRKLSAGIIFEPRYYYNLKNRILKGRSAANLSADFLALQINPIWIWEESRSITTELSIIPVWGFQRRLFNQGFIDYKIGAGVATGNNPIPDNIGEYYFILISDLKIGIAF